MELLKAEIKNGMIHANADHAKILRPAEIAENAVICGNTVINSLKIMKGVFFYTIPKTETETEIQVLKENNCLILCEDPEAFETKAMPKNIKL